MQECRYREDCDVNLKCASDFLWARSVLLPDLTGKAWLAEVLTVAAALQEKAAVAAAADPLADWGAGCADAPQRLEDYVSGLVAELEAGCAAEGLGSRGVGAWYEGSQGRVAWCDFHLPARNAPGDANARLVGGTAAAAAFAAARDAAAAAAAADVEAADAAAADPAGIEFAPVPVVDAARVAADAAAAACVAADAAAAACVAAGAVGEACWTDDHSGVQRAEQKMPAAS